MHMMDAHTLARLIDAHAAALVLYARQWGGAAEDVVQEAFVKLAACRTPPDNPAAWLHRVVRHGAISAARSEKRRRTHESRAAARTASWFLPSEGADLDGRQAAQALEQLPLE